MFTAPKLITNDLITRLNELVGGGEVTEFSLRRLQVEADKLKNDSPADAYELHAMIACVALDEALCRANHKRAMLIDPSPHRRMNYTCSLLSMGYFGEALASDQEAMAQYPGNVEIADSLVSSALAGGAYTLVKEKILDWKRYTGEREHPLDQIISQTVEAMAQLEIHQQQTMDLMAHIGLFMRNQGLIVPASASLSVLGDDADYFVSVQMPLPVSYSEKILSLNLGLAEWLAENADDLLDGKVVFQFVQGASS